jgi:hypothetical protein
VKKIVQVSLCDEAMHIVEQSVEQANADFETGFVSSSHFINEAILTSSVDIKLLQAKHTNVRKSLRLLALDKEIDIETAIKKLQALKNKGVKKIGKAGGAGDEV